MTILFVDGEILRLRQDLVDHLHPLVDPIQERVEDRVSKGDIALLNQLRKAILVLGEIIVVALIEIHLHGIELLQKCLHAALGDLGIQGVPKQMLMLQQRGDGQGDVAVIGARLGKLEQLAAAGKLTQKREEPQCRQCAGGQPIGTTKSFLTPRKMG